MGNSENNGHVVLGWSHAIMNVFNNNKLSK